MLVAAQELLTFSEYYVYFLLRQMYSKICDCERREFEGFASAAAHWHATRQRVPRPVGKLPMELYGGISCTVLSGRLGEIVLTGRDTMFI